MSYISQMKSEIKKDIGICEKLLEKDYVEGKEFSNIVGKYETKYPDFLKGFKNYAKSIGGKGPNEKENLKILKSKLEFLIIEVQNPNLYKDKNLSSNTIVNVSNLNNNYLKVTIEDIKSNINENTYLGDNEKNELIVKLNEIKELQESKEGRTKKWDIAKEILRFIIDKGADIAIMYIPQILKAIQ